MCRITLIVLSTYINDFFSSLKIDKSVLSILLNLIKVETRIILLKNTLLYGFQHETCLKNNFFFSNKKLYLSFNFKNIQSCQLFRKFAINKLYKSQILK